MSTTIIRARSFLFVPATRPERLHKALAAGADVVIADLEDAVASGDKETARKQLVDELAALDRAGLSRLLVRVNAVGTPWHADDLLGLAPFARQGLAGMMVPKAESASALQEIAEALDSSMVLVPLVESVTGWDRLDELARAPRVVRLAFGHLDFQVDMGMRCEGEETELVPVRLALVASTRRALLAPPIDGVTVDANDPGALRRAAQRGRALGFGGKLCIHPTQVAAVNEAFSPTAAEISWARRVLEEAGRRQGDVFSLDGRMVDAPVVCLAQGVLASIRDDGAQAASA